MKKGQRAYGQRRITQQIGTAIMCVWTFAGCATIPFSNIVGIESRFWDSESKKGFGLVVREDGDWVDILTARHVVERDVKNKKSKGQPQRPTEINVIWMQTPRAAKPQFTNATDIFFDEMKTSSINLTRRDTDDLALLRVRKPMGFNWKFCHSNGCMWGDGFEYVAELNQWWNKIPLGGKVTGLPDLANTFKAETPAVIEGSSGTPLFSSSAFYGIITNTEGFSSYGVLAAPIRRFRDRMDLKRYGEIRRPDLSHIDVLYLAMNGSFLGGTSSSSKLLVKDDKSIRTSFLWGVELGYLRSFALGFVLSAEYFPISEDFPDSKIRIDNSAQLYTLSARFMLDAPFLYDAGVPVTYLGPAIGILKPKSTMSLNGTILGPADSRVNDSQVSFAVGIIFGGCVTYYSALNFSIATRLMYVFNGSHSINSIPPYIADTRGLFLFGGTLSVGISYTNWGIVKDLN